MRPGTGPFGWIDSYEWNGPRAPSGEFPKSSPRTNMMSPLSSAGALATSLSSLPPANRAEAAAQKDKQNAAEAHQRQGASRAG